MKGKTGLFTRGKISVVIIAAVILIDQLIKVMVKTNMFMHERIRIADWFYILFTENPGMAFGWEFFDKFFLTSFRIVAVIVIGFYLYRIIKRRLPFGYIICISLILAGAAGNIIDCVFYGMIFNNPPAPMIAEFVPFGTGYESLFHGRVVDMFYFPIIDTNWPHWMPIL